MARARTHEALQWLRANGHDLAALTGGDVQVLLAIDAAWQALGFVDDRAAVISAVGHLVTQVQPKVRHLARELIARALDWADRDRIWREVMLPAGLEVVR